MQQLIPVRSSFFERPAGRDVSSGLCYRRPLSSSATTEAGAAAAAPAEPPAEEDVHARQLPPVAEESSPSWVEGSDSAAEADNSQVVRMLLVTAAFKADAVSQA